MVEERDVNTLKQWNRLLRKERFSFLKKSKIDILDWFPQTLFQSPICRNWKAKIISPRVTCSEGIEYELDLHIRFTEAKFGGDEKEAIFL